MVDQGVITKVSEPTDWVSSLVYSRRSSGKIRICLDPKDLNTAIKRPHYPTPTLDETTHKLSGATIFSKLDARAGYWSVHLDHASSILTTFNSPFGRYRFQRLPFGLNLSQDVFQERMDMILENCEGTISIADDIGVFGRDRSEHDRNLLKLMVEAAKNGLVFNSEKCSIGVSSLPFFGHTFDKDGVHPSRERIDAIRKMPTPADHVALRAFLGVATYLSSFTKGLSALTEPLRNLQKEETFDWKPEHEAAFTAVKDAICTETTLAYFQPSLKSTIEVDASEKGVGATLMQNGRPIAFASKSLTNCESRYANIEREMLAIVYGCEKFHGYVYGKPFEVITDHKPLEMIVRKNLFAAPARLQRMLLRLQHYDFSVKYRPGSTMTIADTLSRFPNADESAELKLEATIAPVQIEKQRLDKIKQEIADDSTLTLLRQTVERGWSEHQRHVPSCLRPYWSFRDEITIDDDLLYKGPQLLIPPKQTPDILTTLHLAHQGVEKTRLLARECVYWVGMNEDIETLIRNCPICQRHSPANRREPLLPHSVPKRPWQRLVTDLFQLDQKHYLLVVDAFSKFPFVFPLANSSASNVVTDILARLFAEHGIPETIVSDNGPQYSSSTFREFAKSWNFTHITSSPYYPRSNGLAERHVQSIKRTFEKTNNQLKALLLMRATPIDCNTKSPAELLYGRKISTLLPTRHNDEPYEKPRARMASKLESSKAYYDARHNTKTLPPLRENERILARNPLTNLWLPATVSKVRDEPRSYNVQTDDNTEYRRNRSDLRQVPASPDNTRSPDTARSSADTKPVALPSSPTPESRRSTRTRRPPPRFIEEGM